MSAWYAFHAMGFYPNAGQDIYLISSPQFGEVTLHMGEGKRFVIQAQNAGKANRYVQAARLNGQPLNARLAPASEIKDGGLLELEMGAVRKRVGERLSPARAAVLATPKKQSLSRNSLISKVSPWRGICSERKEQSLVGQAARPVLGYDGLAIQRLG